MNIFHCFQDFNAAFQSLDIPGHIDGPSCDLGQRLNKVNIIHGELPGFRCIDAHRPYQIAANDNGDRKDGSDSLFPGFFGVLDPGIVRNIVNSHGSILQ